MEALLSCLCVFFLFFSSSARPEVVGLLQESHDSDLYFRRLPVQLDVGSQLKLTMSLGLPRTMLSVLLACNSTYYDVQLDLDFENDRIALGAQRGLNQFSKKNPLPDTIKSFLDKEFSITVQTTQSTFIVAVINSAEDRIWTEYPHPFPLCKARYVLLHGSQSVHSIKFGGLPLMPILESEGTNVASILYNSFVKPAEMPAKAKNGDEMGCSLTIPSNGFAAVSGNVSVYGCNHDFMLVGSMARQCKENGLWTGNQPTCNARTCNSSLPPPPNGYVEVYGRYAAYHCDPGFELWGSPVRECLDIGQWAGIDVHCYVRPKVVKVSTELNINAMLGQPVDFSCTATGLPVPEVVWLRNGKIIIPDNRVRVKVNGVKSKLAIRNVTVGDWGEYTCLASNKLGEDSKTFHLIDDGRCKLHTESWLGDITCANGKCIEEIQQCDGWDDCGDGSDELGCVLPRYKGSRCSKASFECRRASVCIPREWKCNGHVDCSDTDVSDVSDELNCDKFSFWQLSEPLKVGMGISVVAASRDNGGKGSLAVGLACDVDNYAILLNVDLHSGNVSGFAKQNGEWIQRAYIPLSDNHTKMETVNVEVWAADPGFKVAVNGNRRTLFSFQLPSCSLGYAVVGGDDPVKINGVAYNSQSTEEEIGMTVALLSDPAVSKIKTDLEQVLRSSSGGVSLLSSCPDPGPLHHGQKSTKGLHMTFSCNPSYILSGSASRVCQGNGEWSGHLPTCLLPPVVLEMPDKRAIVGDLVQMNCVFSGDPIPAVSWLKDGRPISPGKGRIQVLDRGLESILQIETVADGDFGMYQCQVDSSLGTATQDFQLMKIGSCGVPPLPPPHAVIVTESQTRVTYGCEPFYFLSSGDSARECGSDGIWRGQPPVCHPVCGTDGNMSDNIRRSRRETSGNRSRRVVGGHDSPIGAWPWQVMLERPNGDLLCGGSLVSERTIVTAAHCLQKSEESGYPALIIRVGAHARHSVSVVEQFDAIEDIVIHPDFRNRDNEIYYNDVALIHLRKPIQISLYARPVCLPDSGAEFRPGTLGYVTGWGVQVYPKNRYPWPNVLQQAPVRVVSTSTCNEPKSYGGHITDSMLCAGYQQGGQDSCQGDSGGPLVVRYQVTGKYVLTGITSWGAGCGVPDKYGVYAKVSNFVDWIGENMRR